MRLSFVGLLTAWTAIVLTMAGCGSSGGGEGGTVSGDDNDGSVDLGFDSGPTLGSVVCTPKTCAELGATCGQQGDGCGQIIDCGSCPSPQFCGGNGANHCGLGATDGGSLCVAHTCADLGASCGTQGDGCGSTLDCGDCVS